MPIRKAQHGRVVPHYPFLPKGTNNNRYTEENGRWDIINTLSPDICPCRVCNHPFMEDCSPFDGQPCDCCSEQCT